MPETQLRTTLEELHRELEIAESVDDDARALLVEVLGDIQSVLDRSGEESDRHETLGDRLAEATRRFEESHPSLTAAVNRVASALSNLGI